MNLDSFWNFYINVLDDDNYIPKKPKKKKPPCICVNPNGSLKGIKNIKWRHSFCRRCSKPMSDSQKTIAMKFYCDYVIPLKLQNKPITLQTELEIQTNA